VGVLDVGEHLCQFMDFLDFLMNLFMHIEDDARILYSWNTMTKGVKV
jgi:hypothetical protein